MELKLKKLSKENNIAAAYLRVSTTEQGDNSSIPLQENLAIEYAKNNNLNLLNEYIFKEIKPASSSIDTIFNEESIQNNLKTRPELNKILKLADKGKIQHLIIYSIDRFSRDFEEYITLKLFFEKRNVKIHFTKPDEVITSSNKGLNRLIEVIKANIAELEANIISSRVKQGNAARVKNNLWPGGKIPFGFVSKQIGEKYTSIEKSQFESELVKEVFELYTKGFGYRKIANIMSKNNPYIKWTKSKVEYILKNKTYTGYIYWNRRGGRRKKYKFYDAESHLKSNFQDEACIVDEKLWNEAESIRQNKINLKLRLSSNFLLLGKLYCENCKSPLKGKNYGKNKKSVYRCPKCKTDNDSKKSFIIVNKEDLEQLIINQINYDFEINNIEFIWSSYENEYKNYILKYQSMLNAYKEKIKTLEANIKNIQNLKLNTQYTPDIHKDEYLKRLMDLLNEEEIINIKQKAIIESKIPSLEAELSKPLLSKDKFIEEFTNAIKRLENLDSYKKFLIIHQIVNKIYVNKVDGKIELKIVYNFNGL